MGQWLIDVETENGWELWPVSEITELYLTNEGAFKVRWGDETGTIYAAAYEVLCDEQEDLVLGMLNNLPKKPNALIRWIKLNKANEKPDELTGFEGLMEDYNKD